METRYDYEHQAWVVNGRYEACGHPAEMDCRCYGRVHAGECAIPEPEIHGGDDDSDQT